MANEKRIYKNYYMTNRTYIPLCGARIVRNAVRIGMTDKIRCHPKTTFDGDAALELVVAALSPQEERTVSFDFPAVDASGADVFAVAVNGRTPCKFVRIVLHGGAGEQEAYTVNFPPERWSKLLIDVSDCAFLSRITRADVTFYGKADETEIPDEEYLYIGELAFGHTLDFRFERKDGTAFFAPQSCVSQGNKCLRYAFCAGETLAFPAFPKARYSVLNGVLRIKDTVKLSVRHVRGCKNYRLYIATDVQPEFCRARSAEVCFDGDGIESYRVRIDGFAVSDDERLCGLRLEPQESSGEIELYDVSLTQEKDFLLRDDARAFMERPSQRMRNPYAFMVPKKVYNVKAFGAEGNEYDNDTAAVQAAVDAASANGGGVVLLENGRFVCSHIVLRSNVEFRIAENAMLVQSERQEDYPYAAAYEHDNVGYNIKWAHNFLVHNKPLLYLNKAENVRICGRGKIRMADTGCEAVVMGYPNFGIHCNATIHVLPIGINKCRRIEIRDITVNRASSYHIMFHKCAEVFVNGVRLFDVRCLSADGIGLGATRNALIANVLYVSNDDGVTLNPGYDDPRGRDGWWQVTPGADNSVTNVEVRNCYLNSHYGGGGKAIAIIPWGKSAPNQEYSLIHNVYVYDCILDGGHSVGTWCDDPFHGHDESVFDNTETNNYSPVDGITILNNTYLSVCDLQTLAVTNMVSDCGLRSATHVVNGDFADGLCNWQATGGGAFDGVEKCVRLSAGQSLRQIICSTRGESEFAFEVRGSGEVFIGRKRVPFCLPERGEARVRVRHNGEKNIGVGVRAQTDVNVFAVRKIR